jgi:hypothetical protein
MSMAAWDKSNISNNLTKFIVMKMIAIIALSPGTLPEALSPHAVPEAKAIWSGIESGIVRQVHYRTDKTGAVMELEATSLSEAETYLHSLPMHQKGLITLTDLIPLGHYTGLSSLFSK